jgi:hypothetical protein
MGINRDYPKVLLHAPQVQQGLKVPDLYVSQGIEHVSMLLTVGHLSNDITGSLLRGTIEQVKLEIGLGDSLFTHDLRQLTPVVTSTWIKSTWQFLQEYGLVVHKGTAMLELQRSNDCFLMAYFLAEGYSKNDLRRLNCCRL